MKRAKPPDKARKRAQVPEDGQRRGEGVTLTRLDKFRMNMKIEIMKLLPQEKITMIPRLMMRNK